MTRWDAEAVRAAFPALAVPDEHGQRPLFLDGPGGSQVPQVVLDAVVGYLGRYNSNFGGFADAGRRTAGLVDAARAAAADWLGASPDNVVFGPNSTTLMFNVSRAVARTWRPGDNILVTDLDHFANVSSWRRAAEDAGVDVRVLRLDADCVDLDYPALETLVDDRTRLVAVTAASNVLGTLPDLARVVAAARGVSALVSVDAVHASVHAPVDFAALDADFLFASAYKLGGPHLGVMCGKAEHLAGLRPYKVEPASEVPPGRWEQGTQSFEAMAGLVALLEYWAALGDTNPDRRAALVSAYDAVAGHERSIVDAVLAGLAKRPDLVLYGRPGATGRTPTFAFNVVREGRVVDGLPLATWLGQHNVAVGLGNFYALGAVRALGLEDTGLLRIGCVHYNTVAEIERFFDLLDAGLAQTMRSANVTAGWR